MRILFVNKYYKVVNIKELPGGVISYLIEDEEGHTDWINNPDEVIDYIDLRECYMFTEKSFTILHKKVFISGHRNISKEEFEKYYKSKIDHFIHWIKHSDLYLNSPKKLTFYVGDCEGCDKMAINYIISKLCRNVKLVICSLKEPFEGQIDYSLCSNDNITLIKEFDTHEDRDTYMTVNTNYDILWIRQNEWGSGTAQNFVRRNWLVFDEK